MKTNPPSLRERGSVVIEFTFVVGMLLAMMSATWSLGRVILQERLIRAAAEQAAQMVAHSTPLEMYDADAAEEVTDRAQDMLEAVIDESGNTRLGVDVRCIPQCAAAAVPGRVRVEVMANVSDSTFAFFGFDGYDVNIAVEVPYAGRIPTQ